MTTSRIAALTAAKVRVRGSLTPNQAVPGSLLCTRCFALLPNGQEWADHGPTGPKFARSGSKCEQRQIEIRIMNAEPAGGRA